MNAHPEKSGYEIRVRGQLDAYWMTWFEGWTITVLENDETLLQIAQIDQPRLHSTLTRIRDLNLVLLSVLQIPGLPGKS